jgi:citronellol/citronellal dehydrogenase
VQNLAKSLAVEWAPKGVRVNACAPGLVLSSGLDQYTPEFRQRIITNIHQHLPFKRLASVDEISSAVVYLLSPGAAYVSGHVLKVDGASSSWGAQKWEIAEHSAMPIYQRSKL